MLKRLIFTAWFVCLSVNAASSATKTVAHLTEAQQYQLLKPERSFNILQQYATDIHQLSQEDQLHWYQTLLRVSITLGKMDQVESSIKAMLAFKALVTPDKVATIVSSLGIYMRNQGHHEESIWLFKCGLSQSINSTQRTRLLVSLGISLRQLNRLPEAQAIYQQALVLAQQDINNAPVNSIYNSIGVLALQENNLLQARENFILSMHYAQQKLKRSGHILAGLNLLLVSILQKDFTLYHRLHSPISRLTLSSQNTDWQTYLLWLEKTYQVLHKQPLTPEDGQQLVASLKHLKSFSIHNVLISRLSQYLNVKMDLKVRPHSEYQGDLLNHMPMCTTYSDQIKTRDVNPVH